MTTPAPPQTINGTQFYMLIGDGATPTEGFTYFCVATGISSKHGSETEDIWVPDCNDPTAPAQKQTSVKGRMWDITLTGVADPKKTALVRTSYKAGTPRNFQLMKNLTGANGGYVEQCAFIITDFSEDMTDRGNVRWSATLRGQGFPVETTNA